MAQGRRVERVAALIRKETSELLINGIRDERVHKGMVSITSVEVATSTDVMLTMPLCTRSSRMPLINSSLVSLRIRAATRSTRRP